MKDQIKSITEARLYLVEKYGINTPLFAINEAAFDRRCDDITHEFLLQEMTAFANHCLSTRESD